MPVYRKRATRPDPPKFGRLPCENDKTQTETDKYMANNNRKFTLQGFVLTLILGSLALIMAFVLAGVISENQSIVLFSLTILALLFYLIVRRLR